MPAQLSGVLTALATPFAPDGRIDEKTLRRLVDRSIDGGVDGVVACGSTGEFAAMSGAERRHVVEAVIDQVAGRVPVVAQTGALSTREAVELSRHALAAGASVLMVVTPYYEPLTLDETLHYLRTVAGAVDIPIMLYNLPSATGVNLSPAVVGQLAREVENIQYIKDTSADMAQAGQLIHHHGDVISTFVGWDSLVLTALAEGAAGVMAGTANVMPAELVSIHRALRAGDLHAAHAAWERIFPLTDAIMSAPFIPAVKAALDAAGFPVGSPREPVLGLDAATTAKISSLVKALPRLSASAESPITATAVRRAANAPLLIAAADLPPAQHFVDGNFLDGAPEGLIDVVDPSTETVIARIPEGTAGDIDRAVAAAVRATDHWARLVPKARSEVLHAIADRLAENTELLCNLESANTGKPLAVSREDVAGTIDTFRFMAGALRATTTMAAGDYAENHLSVVLREPLGVVGVITPWNYPLLMAAWKIAPILAAGNTMVIKPSEQTPLTTLKFAELVADLLPPGVVNVVTGYGAVAGARLAEHPDVHMIALTGSVSSGRAVARTAADTLKNVHLELGGKAPVVIFPDADLAAAASSLRFAGFWNSGQECGAACRVLVHESVAEQFVEQLAAEVRTLVVGAPNAGEDVEIGPLVSKAHFDRVTGYLERAKAEGARVVTGGGAVDGPGYFVAPTVLLVSEGAEVTRDEVFGPVVTVETFADEQEAVRRANDVSLGLSASVWTESARRGHDIAARLDFGTVWVNSHLVLANEVPWGGFKGSGYGRDLSIYALDDYSRTKHVMHNHARVS